MEKSFAFNSDLVDGEYDREYDVTELLEYFADLFSPGISPFVANNLQVVANDDMTVTLRPGVLWDTNGCRYKNTEDLTMTLSPADGVRDRIDRISITWKNSEREMCCTVQEGEYGYSPAAPECRRNADYRDYVVADVLVEAGAIKITQSAITDRRLDSDVCGMAAGLLQQIDTKEIFVQFQTWFAETTAEEKAKFVEMVEEYTEWKNSFTQTQEDTFDTFLKDAETEFSDWYTGNTENWETDFNTWFENLKEQLTDDAVTNLQSQIGNLSDLETEDKTSLVAAVNSITNDISKVDNILKEITEEEIDDIINGTYEEEIE